MKKTLKGLLVIAICLTSLFCFSGCGKKKTPISADDFYKKMESRNFVIKDSKSEFFSQ